MQQTEIQTKGKKSSGQASSRSSMSAPAAKKPRRVAGVFRMTGPVSSCCTRFQVPTHSAVPKTAGITVEKLSVESTAYSSVEKLSSPR